MPLGKTPLDTTLAENFRSAEQEFFTQKFSFGKDAILKTAERCGYPLQCTVQEMIEKRAVDESEITLWFSDKSEYGRAMEARFDENDFQRIRDGICAAVRVHRDVTYRTEMLFFSAVQSS